MRVVKSATALDLRVSGLKWSLGNADKIDINSGMYAARKGDKMCVKYRRAMTLKLNGEDRVVHFNYEYSPFTDSYNILNCDIPGTESMIQKFLFFSEHFKLH